MPWSEWQDGDTGLVAWVREVRIARGTEGGTEIYYTVTATSALPTYSRGNDIGSAPTEAWFLSQLRLPSSWATARNWFPSGMAGKVLGVDYDIRPDRAPGDPDRFIQYADGDNTATSSIAGVLFNARFGSGAPPDGTNILVGVDVGTNYVPGVVPAWAGIGSIVDSAHLYAPWMTGGTDISGTFSGSDLFPTTAAQTFTVGVEDNAGVLPEGVGYSFDVNPVAFTNYRMPQWRYWKPGQLPLRQRQRDDGLALRGAPSWRKGTSRQATNRWRSYL